MKPKLSALAVVALLASIPALLTGLTSAVLMIILESGMQLTTGDVDAVRLGAFWTGASAFLMAFPALLMGTTASSLVREGRGTLNGKGAAQAAVFLSLIAALVPVAYVRPQLAELDRSGREARAAAEGFLQNVHEQKFKEALGCLSGPLRERLTESDLKAFDLEVRKRSPRPERLRLRVADAGKVSVGWYSGNLLAGSVEIVLEKDIRWWVSDIRPLVSRLGD